MTASLRPLLPSTDLEADVERLRLTDLVAATGGRLADVPVELTEIVRFGTDSRTLLPGDAFWAFRGPRFDAHDFVPTAVASGAVLAVVDEAHAELAVPRLIVRDTLTAWGELAGWRRRQSDALVIGVTGSVGKTTTRELVYAALSEQYQGMRSAANLNNLYGLPQTLLELRQSDEFAVLELGADRVGEIRDLCAIARPEVGLITSIGKAHAKSFGGVEGIIRGKGELLEALPSSGFAVLPGDDPVVRDMARRAACPVIFVGEHQQNHLWPVQVRATAGSLQFRVNGQDYSVPATGRHFLANALLAIAVGREIGMNSGAIARGLARFEPVDGRCRPRQIGLWTVIDDSYNASPTSMAAALNVLRDLDFGRSARRIAVLGDMRELGECGPEEHRNIGRHAAAAGIDALLAYGDSADELARGAREGGLTSGRIAATDDLEILRLLLDCWLEPGAVVLVKGSRAMQMERVVSWLEQLAEDSGHRVVGRQVA